MKTFSVDTSEPFTLEEIIQANEEFLDVEEIEALQALEVGQSIPIGMVHVERIS